MTKLPILLATLTAACAQAEVPSGTADANASRMVTIEDVKGEAADCALSVRFGSYAMGIDRGAAERIGQLLASAPGVIAVTRHRWGMEGEYTLCVRTASPAAAGAAFERIPALVPEKPRGPVSARLADGREFKAPERR